MTALIAIFLVVYLIGLAGERGIGWDTVLFVLCLLGYVGKEWRRDDDD